MSTRTTPRPSVLAAPPGKPGFYEPALPEAERAIYRRARRARGLEEEIALLRLKLFVLLETKDGSGGAQAPAIARLIDLLIKALRAEGATGDEDRALLDHLLDEESARILAMAHEK